MLANDTHGLEDTARVFIYLLREDQRVRFVLRQHPPEVRNRIETFRESVWKVFKIINTRTLNLYHYFRINNFTTLSAFTTIYEIIKRESIKHFEISLV